MSATVFIGDELTAAGFRLTGIETFTPSPAATRDVLAQARARAELVVLTAEYGGYIPASELDEALITEAPIVVVMRDILARCPPPDLARRLRIILGIES